MTKKAGYKMKVEEGWYSATEMADELQWPQTVTKRLHRILLGAAGHPYED